MFFEQIGSRAFSSFVRNDVLILSIFKNIFNLIIFLNC